mmetsp:Transcript_3777/g.5734  ORF Transcript_3777/g.5734 Transcript_3777/m.5734 type:complete len:147 (+) Transcript_3777:119-559(+)|eukprot:CAMPEP_0184654684 /NCGR_PEP_ID=MMETSP0308-20130426/12347_1 /TAXON_ID=38269 /ORGANISM="Gloeochaete witrockiana, Strain SAG 46.84" /LENGTH=146 /DNA_ID=CAMNT_0027090783 /DNA_START=103 /DNA_END=543 /DNA_ORIENTATION=-
MANPYVILGISKSSTDEQVKRAYIELAKRYHPDVMHADGDYAKQAFQNISDAYRTLSNPHTRAALDAQDKSRRSQRAYWERNRFLSKRMLLLVLGVPVAMSFVFGFIKAKTLTDPKVVQTTRLVPLSPWAGKKDPNKEPLNGNSAD